MVKSMKEQAAARGQSVPVGLTAGYLRKNGWDVSADVPDEAVLTDNPATHSSLELDATSDHSWSTTLQAKILRLACIADDVVLIPELRERLPVLVSQRDEIIEHISELVDDAQIEGLPTLARYYLMLQDYVKSLDFHAPGDGRVSRSELS